MNNAPKNSQAQSKLNELNSLFPDGIRGMERSVQQDIEALNVSLKKLKSRINHAVSN
jgi:secretion system chaperone SseA